MSVLVIYDCIVIVTQFIKKHLLLEVQRYFKLQKWQIFTEVRQSSGQVWESRNQLVRATRASTTLPMHSSFCSSWRCPSLSLSAPNLPSFSLSCLTFSPGTVSHHGHDHFQIGTLDFLFLLHVYGLAPGLQHYLQCCSRDDLRLKSRCDSQMFWLRASQEAEVKMLADPVDCDVYIWMEGSVSRFTHNLIGKKLQFLIRWVSP